jgi:hypothetical protein
MATIFDGADRGEQARLVPRHGRATVGGAGEGIARHEAEAVAVLSRPGRSVGAGDAVVPHGSAPSAGAEGGLSLPAASTAVTVYTRGTPAATVVSR